MDSFSLSVNPLSNPVTPIAMETTAMPESIERQTVVDPSKIGSDVVHPGDLTTLGITLINDNVFLGGASGKHGQEDFMSCSCKYEPAQDPPYMACGEDSECINRALFIECAPDDCPCGAHCLNQRFQRKEYADVEIFRTQGKGLGLRTKRDLKSGEFVMEYCGEVISQYLFVKRTREYSQSGQKHFYFMSLRSDEFIDASQKGNVARFINHSCVPNCVLHKWVVGSRFRMGIFAHRDIPAGTELTFDYKFERYGAQAQVCLCGESACKGFIGGSKQSVIKGVANVEDVEDSAIMEESIAAARQPRAHRGDESDYEDDIVPQPKLDRPLETIDDVTKVVKYLLQTNGKTARVRDTLRRLEVTSSQPLLRKFLQLHGLIVLKGFLGVPAKADIPTCAHALRVLQKLPFTSRNSLFETKVEDMVTKLADCLDDGVAQMAKDLLSSWGNLGMAYKIPKKPLIKIESKTDMPFGNEASSGSPNTLGGVKRPSDGDELSLPKRTKSELEMDSQAKSRSASLSSSHYDRTVTDVRPRDDGARWPKDSRDHFRNSHFSHRHEHDRYRPYSGSSYADNRYPLHRTGSFDQQNPYVSYITDVSRHRDGIPEGMTRLQKDGLSRPPPPAPEEILPAGWRAVLAEEGMVKGKTYYYHEETREVTWTKPMDTKPELASEGKAVVTAPTVQAVSHPPGDGDARPAKNEQRLNATPPDVDHASVSNGKGQVDELSKALREGISKLVVKAMNKYKHEMDVDKFKKHARKITHAILEKESKSAVVPDTVTEEMSKKVKKFVDSYLMKALRAQ